MPGRWLLAGAVCLLALGWLCASDVRADEKKEPAHQVPVEELEAELAAPGESEDGAAAVNNKPDGKSAEADKDTSDNAGAVKEKEPAAGKEKPPQEATTKPPAEDKPKAADTKPNKNTPPASEEAGPGSGADFGGSTSGSGGEANKNADAEGSGQKKASTQPGLPRRKPPKPNVRRIPLSQTGNRRKTPAGRDRDRYLCESLQACRNDFIKCKSKIKHPDQSQAWIDEKEACGVVYKECVEQHFKPGEWFFTRWFYFQELDCK